jgi:hypothetical protein
MSNLAEVGFFADLLEAEGLTTRVQHRHDFAALDGVWETFYELHVSSDVAEKAVQVLRTELAGENTVDEPPLTGLETGAPRPNMLRPLLFAAVAGGLAYWVGRSGVGPPPAPTRADALWHVVAESPPFWSEPTDGFARRRLRFDAATQSVIIDDDFDGDGHFDRRRRIAY